MPAFAMPPAAVPAAEPAPQFNAAPFNDVKGLMAYTMEKYKALGPAKGGAIQDVLNSMGCAALGNLQPAQYTEFHQKVSQIV